MIESCKWLLEWNGNCSLLGNLHDSLKVELGRRNEIFYYS